MRKSHNFACNKLAKNACSAARNTRTRRESTYQEVRMGLTERQRRLYETIVAAARAGQVCPTNREIADLSGLVSASAVADALGRLQRKGVVDVVRFNRARVVRFPGLGLETAAPRDSALLFDEASYGDRRFGDAPTRKDTKRTTLRSLFPPPAPWRRQGKKSVWKPSQCQFIAGNPRDGDEGKCGRPVCNGSPYCEHHHKLCYAVSPRALR